MSKLRTANLIGALALEIASKLDRHGKAHSNETSSAAAALNVIGFYEGCSNGDLSRALALSHTATVRLVDKLEAKGLVRSEAGADRRFVVLRLTASGRKQARSVVGGRCALLSDILRCLAPEQMAQLERIAETLLGSMVAAPDQADHICRLCDEVACPPDECPVHRKASTLEVA